MNIRNLKDMPSKKWEGGTTVELYRDIEKFNIRISCASIDEGSSVFSDFTGYKRILNILEGSTLLEIDNKKIELLSNHSLYFDGNKKVSSKNQCKVLDFNIIYRESSIKVSFDESKNYDFRNDYKNLFIFSRMDNVKLYVDNNIFLLKKYDFLLLDKTYDFFKIEGDVLLVDFGKNFN